MATSVNPDAISGMIANPDLESSDLVIQVVDLIPLGRVYKFTAFDGKTKIKAVLSSGLGPEVLSGKIQNLCLIRVGNYQVNNIKNENVLLVHECEVVSPPVPEIVMKSEEPKQESRNEPMSQGNGIVLKPKQEVSSKSAAQIIHEQNKNVAPARMAMTRRVHPLVSLNPYQGNWTIKVRVTSKGSLRTYKNARGEGCVFNVELTDEDGTQIQATMFNAAANKFFNTFEMGKVYYISKGSLKVANKQFRTVQNDYEMTLNEYSEVEECSNEVTSIPEIKFNFVPIDQLGSYTNSTTLVDVIGVVQSVSETMSIRRKSNDEMIPKRDITIADDSKKTVVVTLWNESATTVGQQLLDMADKSPIVAIKSCKVSDFSGVSLSALSKSFVLVNPDTPDSNRLRSWFESGGKDTPMESAGAGMAPSAGSGKWSMYSDRVPLTHITSDMSLGEEKVKFFSIRATIGHIKPDQAMWYHACKMCTKKVNNNFGSGYHCESCQKDVESSLRFIVTAKVCDSRGEAWLSLFNDQAERIFGCSADELENLKSEQNEEYVKKLKSATWTCHHFRVSVKQHVYNGEKRQRITARVAVPVGFAAEAKFLLKDIVNQEVSH